MPTRDEPPAPVPVPVTVPFAEQDFLRWLRDGINEHAIVAVTDLDGIILYANDRFCEIAGYSRAELVGKTHRLVKSDQHPPQFFEEMWATLRRGEVWHGTLCNRSKDGQPYWVESTLIPFKAHDGTPQGYLALRTNVTALKQAETEMARLAHAYAEQAQELGDARSQIQVFFEHAPIGMSWSEISPEGIPGDNHLNRRFCELIGLTPHESRNLDNIRRITPAPDWEQQEKLTRELYEGRRDSFTLKKRYLHKDGRVVWGELTLVVLRGPHGRVTHQFAMLEDVTARQAAEQMLRRSEARWRTYLQIASEILYALTPEGRYKFVSDAWTPKLGHPVEEVLGHAFTEFIHPEDLPIFTEYFKHTLAESPRPVGIEYRTRHLDGRWIWHASTGSAYTDRDGRRAFFGVGRDITLRRNAQDALKTALAKREELERIVDRSPSVVVLWRAENGHWPVEFVSRSVRQFGYQPEDFTSRRLNFADVTHPDDRERVATEVEAHAAAYHREYNQEYRILCADGSVRWVDDHTVVRLDAEGNVTHHEGLIADITARKLADERERAMRERDLRLAGEVQHHLRPHVFPDISAVEIEALSQPSTHIGGDYYDVLPVDARRWGFVIADVAGKGPAAALMMAACRATLRLCARGEPSAAAVVRRVNQAIHGDMPSGMFITLFYGILDLDTNLLRYVRAGHEPPLHLRPGVAEPGLLSAGGLALGFDDGTVFDTLLEEGELQLQPGDMLALYTDGITEAANAVGDEFGRERFAEALTRDSTAPLTQVIARLDRYLRQFSALASRNDDRTLLLVRTRAVASAPRTADATEK